MVLMSFLIIEGRMESGRTDGETYCALQVEVVKWMDNRRLFAC